MKKKLLFCALSLMLATSAFADSFKLLNSIQGEGDEEDYNVGHPYYSEETLGDDYIPLKKGWVPGKINMQYIEGNNLYIKAFNIDGSLQENISTELPTIKGHRPSGAITYHAKHGNMKKVHKFCMVYYYHDYSDDDYDCDYDEDAEALVFLDENLNVMLTLNNVYIDYSWYNTDAILFTKNANQGFSDSGSYIFPLFDDYSDSLLLIEWDFNGTNGVNSIAKEEESETRYYRLDGTRAKSLKSGINIKSTIDRKGRISSQKILKH